MESYCDLAPWGAVRKGTASLAMQTSGPKGSWREAETWLLVAGSESLRTAQQSLLVKVQTSCHGDPNILEMPVPWDYTKDSSCCREEPPEPRKWGMYALDGRAREIERPKEPRRLRVPDVWIWAWHCRTLVFLWFGCNCVLVLLS